MRSTALTLLEQDEKPIFLDFATQSSGGDEAFEGFAQLDDAVRNMATLFLNQNLLPGISMPAALARLTSLDLDLNSAHQPITLCARGRTGTG
jgi:hypothetical protein